MTNALQRQDNDLGLHSVAPSSPTDARVRLAEEDSLASLMAAYAASLLRKVEWTTPVTLSVDANRILSFKGSCVSRVYPTPLHVDTTISLPPLESNTSLVRKEDRIYLVVIGAIVGQEHDPELGKINFQRFDDVQNRTLVPVQKENAKRDRAYWLLVQSSVELAAEDFYSTLPQEPTSPQQPVRLTGDRYLRVSTLSDAGFTIGSGVTLRVYARDPRLVQADYPILKDFVEVLEVGRILRIQNHEDEGYTWGRNGEEPLSNRYNVIHVAGPQASDLESRILHRLTSELFAGIPGRGVAYTRTIRNLTAGVIGGNPGRAGISAAAPNGSVCLANNDRVTFTNQKFLQTVGVQVVTAANDGSGNAVVTATMNGNAPDDTRFSEKPSDHKIYKADGTEHSAFGRFVNLGGTGSLVWLGTTNSSLRPGQECYVQPGLETPAGSGFSVPFRATERVWINGTPLAPQNVRAGESEDLDAYESPSGSDSYIVVMCRARAALLYAYKKVTVLTDANGVAVIPATEKGAFAFIEGVNGRLDSPVVTKLVPNTTYNALVYYPPRSNESWQFQLSYCPYQGTGELDFLDGAVVASRSYCFLTTQGGGTSVYRGGGDTRFSPISMHLPSTDQEGQAYELDAPLHFPGESRPGPKTLRESTALPGAGLVLPSPGVVIQASSLSGLNNGRTLNVLLSSQEQPLGFYTPVLSRRVRYQAILAFVVRKQLEERLVIATRIGAGGENVHLSTARGTAIDTFRI